MVFVRYAIARLCAAQLCLNCRETRVLTAPQVAYWDNIDDSEI
jgi:hypothetical protein